MLDWLMVSGGRMEIGHPPNGQLWSILSSPPRRLYDDVSPRSTTRVSAPGSEETEASVRLLASR